MVHAGGGDEVPHVVHLEIHGVAEARNVFALALADLNVSVDVAVGCLRLGDQIDHRIHLLIEFAVLREREYRSRSLQPLVEVTVIPLGPTMPSLDEASGNLKVAQE